MSDASAGRSYADIVWQQFRANRLAYYSLWGLAPLYALATLAPLLASNVPFVFSDGQTTIFPWWNHLFHTPEPVDFLFNMGLLAIVPAVLVVLVRRPVWRRSGAAPRSQVRRAITWHLGLTLALVALFTVPERWFGLKLAPRNPYASRSFPAELWEAAERAAAAPPASTPAAGAQRPWAIFPPLPLGPYEVDQRAVFQPPGFRKPRADWRESNDGTLRLLGTDDTGRDVLVQMLYGTRVALTVGLVAVGLYLSIGCVLGALAGYFGGWVDILISRTIEVVLLFPTFFLILTLVSFFDEGRIYVIMLAIGITGWPSIARLTRGEVLKQRSLDYVMAARALGASSGRIIFRHVIPNSLGPALVSAPFGVASAIITEAGLSVLGLGVRPPAPSWGALLRLGSGNYNYWWTIVVPSVAIFYTVTILNLIGGGLRDAMDPRLRETR